MDVYRGSSNDFLYIHHLLTSIALILYLHDKDEEFIGVEEQESYKMKPESEIKTRRPIDRLAECVPVEEENELIERQWGALRVWTILTQTATKMASYNPHPSDKTSTIQLRRELKEKDDFLKRKDAELQHRQRVIEEKDVELAKLRKEIHELKCVVQQTAYKTSILSTIQEDRGTAGNSRSVKDTPRPSRKEKRMAVSGESSSTAQKDTKKELERHPKDFRLGLCCPCCSSPGLIIIRYNLFDWIVCFSRFFRLKLNTRFCQNRKIVFERERWKKDSDWKGANLYQD